MFRAAPSRAFSLNTWTVCAPIFLYSFCSVSSVAIPTPSKVPGVLYYPIRVRCGKTEWLAERRYSEFLPLVHGELKRASGRRGGGGSDEAGRLEAAAAAAAAVRAALPPKGYCKAPTPSFLVHRREGLQEVLSQLLSMEGSSRAQDVQKFLELDQGEDLSLPFSPGPPSRA